MENKVIHCLRSSVDSFLTSMPLSRRAFAALVTGTPTGRRQRRQPEREPGSEGAQRSPVPWRIAQGTGQPPQRRARGAWTEARVKCG